MPTMRRDTRERVGVLGGTFDPVHNAHLVAAVTVRYVLGLDRVVLVVAGDPWQKRGIVIASAADRLAMTRAAVADIDGLEVSDIEVERSGPTYTIDTLRAFTAADRDLFLIVGSDVAAALDSWHEADAVRAAATLVVVERASEGVTRFGVAGTPPAPAPGPGDTVHVRIPHLDISSSHLRAKIGNGEPIDGLVPPGAVRVLRERRLYTRP